MDRRRSASAKAGSRRSPRWSWCSLRCARPARRTGSERTIRAPSGPARPPTVPRAYIFPAHEEGPRHGCGPARVRAGPGRLRDAGRQSRQDESLPPRRGAVIVVGDNGVFIIEVKNVRGTITGHVTDHDLTQTKQNRDGKKYVKTIYNPIKQVETHRERLKDILKSNKINIPIENIVAFVNKDIHLNLQGKSSTKLFTIRRGKEHSIIQYLVDFKGNITLNKNQKDKIIQSILNANK